MSAPVVELALAFGFDAAHRFEAWPDGHPNRRLHGHSFQVEVAGSGPTDPATGFVLEYSQLESVCFALRDVLDHRLLNEIEGLEQPSLERLCVWIWNRLTSDVDGIARVTVRRNSVGQSCTYRGPADS